MKLILSLLLYINKYYDNRIIQMKKSILYIGIGYTLLGVISLIIALSTEFKFESILWGLCGAGIEPVGIMICKYAYWSKPENEVRYNEKLKVEKIEMGDERKIMLRDKSGCLTYRIMIVIYCILIMIFSVLAIFEYFIPFSKYTVIGLSILLIFQYICGTVI